MRQRFTAEQWANWLEEFDRSDLSIKAFCQRLGVSENTFYQWRKKLDQPVEPSPAGPFVPIAVVADDQSLMTQTCTLSNRVTMRQAKELGRRFISCRVFMISGLAFRSTRIGTTTFQEMLSFMAR